MVGGPLFGLEFQSQRSERRLLEAKLPPYEPGGMKSTAAHLLDTVNGNRKTKAPRGANLERMRLRKNPWKLLERQLWKLFGNLWQSLAILGKKCFGNLWQSLAIFGNLWQSLEFPGISWTPLEIFGK